MLGFGNHCQKILGGNPESFLFRPVGCLCDYAQSYPRNHCHRQRGCGIQCRANRWGDAIGRRDAINCVSTIDDAGNAKPYPIGWLCREQNPLLNNNLSRIVRWFKGRTTFEARKNNPLFAWQPNYYEHIIRNKKSFANIQHYIINNPIHWNNDKLYTQPK